MKLFPLAEFADEDVCSPHEMNLELGTIAQEHNGNLDLENVAASAVTAAKLKRNNNWMRFMHISVTPTPGTLQLDQKRMSKSQVLRLPKSTSANDFMQVLFAAVEGAIVIRGGAFLRNVTSESNCWSLVFLVDGRVVWESGTIAAYSHSARDGETAVWVGPGTRKIEMAIRIFDETANLSFESGNLYVKQYGV